MRVTMMLLLFVILIGFLGVLVFAFAPLNVSNWRYLRAALSIASVCGGVGGAALLIGVLLGFLFGIPRTLQGDVPDKATRTYQVNTNLEQISDWLTKIIVGVTLIDLRTIPGHLMEISEYLAPALGGGRRAEAMAGGSILYFSVAGFFFGYLGTRLYLASAIPWADEESNIGPLIARAKQAVARDNIPPRLPNQPDASTPRPAPEVQQLVQYTDATSVDAARLRPADARTIALSYYLNGDYDKAVKFFDRANDKITNDPTFTMKHAISLAQSGEHDRAIRLLDELAEEGLGKPEVHQLLGYYLLSMPQRLDDAVRHNLAYLQANPDDGSAHLNLAAAYDRQADQAAAKGDLAKADGLRRKAVDELRLAIGLDDAWRSRAEALKTEGYFGNIPKEEFERAIRPPKAQP
jgi:tetratricopeptide (TPR) repeat protein